MSTPDSGRRSETSRLAILNAALDLVAEVGYTKVAIERIATSAGVGKQTIYRWWPSKGAVLLEALTTRAALAVPPPCTGTLAGDLREFLVATFAGVTAASRVLGAVMAEAQRDPHAAELLHEFTGRRREALRALFAGHSGELAPGTDVDLLVDQAFGLMWYRMLTGHADLTDRTAAALAAALCRQAN